MYGYIHGFHIHTHTHTHTQMPHSFAHHPLLKKQRPLVAPSLHVSAKCHLATRSVAGYRNGLRSLGFLGPYCPPRAMTSLKTLLLLEDRNCTVTWIDDVYYFRFSHAYHKNFLLKPAYPCRR